jgi:hypothetical protein
MSWAHPGEIAAVGGDQGPKFQPLRNGHDRGVHKSQEVVDALRPPTYSRSRPRTRGVWVEVAPKKLFGALGGVAMTASPGRQESQSQSLAALGLVKVAPQGIADQGRHRELFSLGQKVQLTIRAFFEKEGGPLHMSYDAMHASRRSIEATRG